MNSIRLYDDGLVNYLQQNIFVDDGTDNSRSPQIIFALPSKKSLSKEDNNEYFK
mgnify:CR=1 FL=1